MDCFLVASGTKCSPKSFGIQRSIARCLGIRRGPHLVFTSSLMSSAWDRHAAFTGQVNSSSYVIGSSLPVRRRQLIAFIGLYRVAQTSKPLSRVIIKSALKPPSWLDFSSIPTTKWAQEYTKSVLNILCVT